jgi:hypothetical protein
MNTETQESHGAVAGQVERSVRPLAGSHVYRWTERNGCVTTLRLSDCTAERAAEEAAAFGWKPPKWWQWWRRDDYPRTVA